MANITGTNFSDLFLFGTYEADTINGLDGNDIIRPGDGVDDTDGGDGSDTLDYSNFLFSGPTEGVIVSLFFGTEINDGFGNRGTVSNVENIIGSDFNDSLGAGAEDAVLEGRGGNDRLEGFTGNDLLKGGAGNDWLSGSGGNDILYGGPGEDILGGGSNDDRVFGGSGNDSVDGGFGNDLLDGGSGDDFLNGSLDDDTLLGRSGNDVLSGGVGTDTKTGGSGDDIFQFARSRGDNLGQDEITDFQDDGGFLGFLNTLTGEDELRLVVFNLQADDQTIAIRNGDTLDVRIDTDGDLNSEGDRLDFVSIQFASEFIVDNIDEDDLTADSSDIVFL